MKFLARARVLGALAVLGIAALSAEAFAQPSRSGDDGRKSLDRPSSDFQRLPAHGGQVPKFPERAASSQSLDASNLGERFDAATLSTLWSAPAGEAEALLARAQEIAAKASAPESDSGAAVSQATQQLQERLGLSAEEISSAAMERASVEEARDEAATPQQALGETLENELFAGDFGQAVAATSQLDNAQKSALAGQIAALLIGDNIAEEEAVALAKSVASILAAGGAEAQTSSAAGARLLEAASRMPLPKRAFAGHSAFAAAARQGSIQSERGGPRPFAQPRHRNPAKRP
jgi:hypothetical protein